jgi:hypothetical protein
LTLLAGCSTPGGPSLTAVIGKITLDDKPVAGAKVMFIPQGATLGHGGIAITGDDGQYEIVAQRANNRKGLQSGEYKVVVTRFLMPDGSPLPQHVPQFDSGAKESIPEPYCLRDGTPLEATIDATIKSFDFALKTKQ